MDLYLSNKYGQNCIETKSNLNEGTKKKFFTVLDSFYQISDKIPSFIYPENNLEEDAFMYLSKVTLIDDSCNEENNHFTQVLYQGAKISQDGQDIIPQYFEAYFQLKQKVCDIFSSQSQT